MFPRYCKRSTNDRLTSVGRSANAGWRIGKTSAPIAADGGRAPRDLTKGGHPGRRQHCCSTDGQGPRFRRENTHSCRV